MTQHRFHVLLVMAEGSGSGYLDGMLIRSWPLCFCDMQWLKSPGCIPLWVIKDATLSLGKHITTGFPCEHHMPSDPVYAIQELLGWQLETDTARWCLAHMLGALATTLS